MVDSTRDIVKQQIVAHYVSGLDQCPTTDSMVQPTLTAIKDLHKVILTGYSLYLSVVDNPQENIKEKRNAINTLLMRLQDAIELKNFAKNQELNDLKDLLANQELSL